MKDEEEGRGDAEKGDAGTRREVTLRHGDAATRRGDAGTRRRGDAETRGDFSVSCSISCGYQSSI